MNATTQQATQYAPTQAREDIDLDSYVEEATVAFQRATAANQDTSRLKPEHRAALLNELARALRLNPLTKPVIFLKTGQGEAIYVTRQGADQIAARLKLNRETVEGPDVRKIGNIDVAFCRVKVTAPDGRSETSTATLAFSDPAMILMKVETKAKRRATLSIAGLGMLSEEDAEEMGIDATIDRTAPQAEPTDAQNRLALDLDDCTVPSDAVDIWMRHRTALTADGDGVREEAWGAVVKHVMRLMEVKKTAAEKYIRGRIAEIDAETRAARSAIGDAKPEPESTAAPTPEVVEPPTLADYNAQLSRASTLDAIADLWRASRYELVEGDRVPAWQAALVRLAALRGADSVAGMGAILKARIAQLDAPPPPPPTGTDAPPANDAASAHGDAITAAQTAGAQALRTVLDTDTAHITITGTWRADPAQWRTHLAAKHTRREIENSVACNGAALGPEYIALAAERIVALDALRPKPADARALTVIGVTQTLERIAYDASRQRAAAAAGEQRAA